MRGDKIIPKWCIDKNNTNPYRLYEKMKKTDIEGSSVEKRAALYEFSQAAEKGMKRADALNRQMNEKKE